MVTFGGFRLSDGSPLVEMSRWVGSTLPIRCLFEEQNRQTITSYQVTSCRRGDKSSRITLTKGETVGSCTRVSTSSTILSSLNVTLKEEVTTVSLRSRGESLRDKVQSTRVPSLLD